MRILFRCEQGEEVEGLAERISTRGAFVRTNRSPMSRTDMELHLWHSEEQMRVEAQVLGVESEGFTVVFHALHPDDLIRLRAWLDPETPSLNEEPAGLASLKKPTMPNLLLEGWRPKVTEPTLHQWRPKHEMARPRGGDGVETGTWHNLATIAPTVAPPKPEQMPRQELPPAIQVPTQETNQTVTGVLVEENASEPSGGRELRTEIREEKSIPVTFDDVTGLIKEFTHNISFGGLFTYTSKPFKAQEEVAVTLIHPVHQERLTLLAIVAHATDAPSPDPITGQNRYGVGLQFRLPIEELKRLLSDFISSHKMSKTEPEDSEILNLARQALARAEQGHHALLELDQNANAEKVRQAYFALVDRFHPDRYFDKVSDTTRKLLEELFRKLTQAYETLCA